LGEEKVHLKRKSMPLKKKDTRYQKEKGKIRAKRPAKEHAEDGVGEAFPGGVDGVELKRGGVTPGPCQVRGKNLRKADSKIHPGGGSRGEH